MDDRYEIRFTEGGVSALETVLTGGLALAAEKAIDTVSGDDKHGWYCTIKDRETEAEVSKWGATKSEAQEAAFRTLKDEIHQQEKEQEQEIEKRKYQQQVRQREQQQRASHDTSSEDGGGYALLGKIIGGLIVIAAIVWFVFAIAIPLIIINIAIITLILGLTKKGWYKFILPVSVLGAIYIVLDYNKGWFTKTLVSNVSFFEGAIPVFFYLNIIAGLIAAYFLTRNLLNEKKPQTNNAGEFSKRNLIIIGCLLLVGGVTIGLQTYLRSKNIHGTQSFVSTNSNSNGATDRTIVDNSSKKANPKINSSASAGVPIVSTNSSGSNNNPISDTNDSQTKPTNTSKNNSIEKTSSITKFTDERDGKVYKTVQIGNQIWMAENFAYKANAGCWAYNDDESKVSFYGYLYNWETAIQNYPKGWHLPSNEEWRVLEKYLGGSEVAGDKLKEEKGWVSRYTKPTNSSGFTARHGGYRCSDGSFSSIDESGGDQTACAYWWTSTDNTDFATTKCVYSTNYCIKTDGFGKRTALSVRYVKD